MKHEVDDGHPQVIVSQVHHSAGQQEDLVMGNRAQPVLLPQGNSIDNSGAVLLDPMTQANLAGSAMPGFYVPMQQSGRHETHRQGNLIGDPFNEESGVELSSIENTAFNERQTNQN